MMCILPVEVESIHDIVSLVLRIIYPTARPSIGAGEKGVRIKIIKFNTVLYSQLKRSTISESNVRY